MAHEIWEVRTGNLVASSGYEHVALALIRDAVAARAEAYAETLALVHEFEADGSTTVATSNEIIQ